MGKIFYCPECKSQLEEISGCGAVAYFCDKCKKLISKKKIMSEEELKEPPQNSLETGNEGCAK